MSCKKFGHETKKHAMNHIEQMKGKHLNAYKCLKCSRWHVGHTFRKPK